MSITSPVPQASGATLAALLLGTALLSGPAAGQWPVADPVVTSGFRPPERDWGAGHRGVDLAARTGDEVRSVTDGIVTVAGAIAGKPVVAVAIPGAGQRRVTYEPVLPRVRVGDAVRAGDVIGVLAAGGGHCGGAAGCLHLGLRSGGTYLDPLSLLGRRPAVLKPL